MSILGQRCSLHAEREAAVRCPGCSRFYCRECVTEHRGRMMCAHCVARLSDVTAAPRSRVLLWVPLSFCGLLMAWLVFYYLGMGLARIPSTFHGGPP